ncbi:hypothetical protein HJC23_007260 [Cyclotella cryptica]|uniref:Cytochrome P450 n=1 Tax=Cyclotella cryptica TaxID=29204 RepID=A0ABD3Q009_9STRA|eukprot:CCRYP_010046-RA/>CCRYP_010046-RA protein AED:0.20 eAED:0.20 QI:205/1/1/1/1/1/2/3397/614
MMLRNSSNAVLRKLSSCPSFKAHDGKLVMKTPLVLKSHATTRSTAPFSTQSAPTKEKPIIANASDVSTSKCPFSTVSSTLDAIDTAKTDREQSRPVPTLKDVPSVPLLGVFVNAIPFIGDWLNDNFYHNPNVTPHNAYDVHYEMYQKYGTFYTTYIPGIGEGLYPKVYMIMDPEEMKKVIRQEGAYPRGGVEGLKPMVKWMKKNNFKLAGAGSNDNGFLGRGETWRKYRNFMQTDLLSPKSASGYVPGVANAAKIASRGVPYYASDLNTFFNYAAFDMFQSIMFGQVSKLADPNTSSNPVDVEFCRLAVDSLAYLVRMSDDPQEAIKASLGIETELYYKFDKTMDALKDIVMEKLTVFIERWDRNELDDNERKSYFAHAIERQRAEESGIDESELMQICLLMLNASVDTTSTFICWAMVHLSTNLHVQENLYRELKQHLDASEDGMLHAEMLTKAKSPYLHAVLRESHRMTPVYPSTMFKSNSVADIEIHGVTVPKGSVVGFDSYPIGMDPMIVDQPERFIPERWIGDEPIQARKGTPAEVLDSVMYRDPFSQGARRCPGSRVAVNETQLILSQLVLDWKISAPPSVKTYRDIPYKMQTLLVAQLPEMNVEARV